MVTQHVNRKRTSRRAPAPEVRLATLKRAFRYLGWDPGGVAGWSDEETDGHYQDLLDSGTKCANLTPGAVAMEFLFAHRPDSVRGNMYLLVSSGWPPGTGDVSYNRIQRLLNRLRLAGAIPFSWVVDNVRSTIKPAGWPGLDGFAEAVASAYRLDFWAALDDYVELIVGKDTVAGKIASATRHFDVPLHPIRGCNSTSFAYEIASRWEHIRKDITIYYMGDHDPSGRDLKRDIKTELATPSRRRFSWRRLATERDQFKRYAVRPLEPKKKDRRYKRFLEQGWYDCAEVEAIPANHLRFIVESAIFTHIPAGAWERLKEVERLGRQQWVEYMAAMFPARFVGKGVVNG